MTIPVVDIPGVTIKKLVKHVDDRGHLFELLRRDDPQYTTFGQAYVSESRPGVVRAWHYHRTNYEYFCCVKGRAILVLYDLREGAGRDAGIRQITLSEEEPLLVRVPPLVAHGLVILRDSIAIMVDFDSEPYNPDNPDKVLVSAPQEVPCRLEDLLK